MFPWLDTSFKQLSDRIAAAKLHHALLIQGPSGLGKASFTMQLGQLLLCKDRQGDKVCGQCQSCLLNAANTHPAPTGSDQTPTPARRHRNGSGFAPRTPHSDKCPRLCHSFELSELIPSSPSCRTESDPLSRRQRPSTHLAIATAS